MFIYWHFSMEHFFSSCCVRTSTKVPIPGESDKIFQHKKLILFAIINHVALKSEETKHHRCRWISGIRRSTMLATLLTFIPTYTHISKSEIVGTGCSCRYTGETPWWIECWQPKQELGRGPFDKRDPKENWMGALWSAFGRACLSI